MRAIGHQPASQAWEAPGRLHFREGSIGQLLARAAYDDSSTQIVQSRQTRLARASA